MTKNPDSLTTHIFSAHVIISYSTWKRLVWLLAIVIAGCGAPQSKQATNLSQRAASARASARPEASDDRRLSGNESLGIIGYACADYDQSNTDSVGRKFEAQLAAVRKADATIGAQISASITSQLEDIQSQSTVNGETTETSQALNTLTVSSTLSKAKQVLVKNLAGFPHCDAKRCCAKRILPLAELLNRVNAQLAETKQAYDAYGEQALKNPQQNHLYVEKLKTLRATILRLRLEKRALDKRTRVGLSPPEQSIWEKVTRDRIRRQAQIKILYQAPDQIKGGRTGDTKALNRFLQTLIKASIRQNTTVPVAQSNVGCKANWSHLLLFELHIDHSHEFESFIDHAELQVRLVDCAQPDSQLANFTFAALNGVASEDDKYGQRAARRNLWNEFDKETPEFATALDTFLSTQLGTTHQTTPQ